MIFIGIIIGAILGIFLGIRSEKHIWQRNALTPDEMGGYKVITGHFYRNNKLIQGYKNHSRHLDKKPTMFD